MSTDQPAAGQPQDTKESSPFWLLDSDVTGCQILAVAAKDGLQAARRAHPGVPVFIGPEIETLAAFPPGEARDRLVRAAVAAKRILGGSVVPGGTLGVRP